MRSMSSCSHHQPRPELDTRRFVAKTAWLRPYTRWAARVSLNAPRWVPGVLRNLPLKVSALVLKGYHLALR
jgi:hypothetical protein